MNNAVIDCRSALQYQQGHHLHAAHFKADELFERMHELPSRHTSISLYCCPESIATAQRFFKQKGYQIDNTVVWSDKAKQQLQQQGLFATGSDSKQLWQAANIVQHFQQHIAPNLQNSQGIHAKRALDIGAGAGRDSVYLAQHGWQVHAIDKNADACKRLQNLAKVHQVAVSHSQQSIEQLIATPMTQKFDLIVVVRFLHRPLFNWIIDALASGGVVIFQTFLTGCEAIGSPKNPNFILQKNELREVFAEFDILLDEVEYLSDGRPLSAFIAQKKTLN